MVYMSKAKRKRVVRQRLLTLAIVVVVIVAILVSIWQIGLGGTAATVNGTAIRNGTLNGVDAYLEYMQYGQFIDKSIDSTLSGSEKESAQQSADDSLLVQRNNTLLSVCVPTEVLKQHFSDVSKNGLSDETNATIKQYTDDQFSAYDTSSLLKSGGVKKSHVKYYYEYTFLMTALQDEVLEADPITDEDAQAYYDEHIDWFTTPMSMEASHILIADTEHTQEKRAEIEAILERINNGEDFAELAMEYSEDSSAESGGELGSFGIGDMVSEFEDAVLALEPGEVSGVVETEYGYHIIKLTSRTEESVSTVEEARTTIDYYLGSERTQEALDVLIDEAAIVYNGITDPETGEPPITVDALENARNPVSTSEDEGSAAEDGSSDENADATTGTEDGSSDENAANTDGGADG